MPGKKSYLSATKYIVIFFIFFKSPSTVLASENISAEIASVVTKENASLSYVEINQPRAIQFPQTKERFFQEN